MKFDMSGSVTTKVRVVKVNRLRGTVTLKFDDVNGGAGTVELKPGGEYVLSIAMRGENQ